MQLCSTVPAETGAEAAPRRRLCTAWLDEDYNIAVARYLDGVDGVTARQDRAPSQLMQSMSSDAAHRDLHAL